MSDRAHIIEIDHIVLTGATECPSDRLRSLVEAEVQSALSGTGIPRVAVASNREMNVAGEIAGSVVQAVKGRQR